MGYGLQKKSVFVGMKKKKNIFIKKFYRRICLAGNP